LNNVIPIGATVRTMTSREIAAIAEKRHDNVMRVCRDLRDTGVCPQIEETPYIEPTNGQTYTQCLLNQRDSYVVMARLSPEFTARLVDRWQALEQAAAPTPAPVELSRMDILRLAMESEEARLRAEAERDKAIRTKALIGSKREATAMATAAAAKRESAKLRQQLGSGIDHATITAVQNATGTEYPWPPLRRWCRAEGISPVNVPDKRYGHVNSWPRCAWLAVHGVDLAELFGEVTP
jgi:phage regulator Rha-like protein